MRRTPFVTLVLSAVAVLASCGGSQDATLPTTEATPSTFENVGSIITDPNDPSATAEAEAAQERFCAGMDVLSGEGNGSSTGGSNPSDQEPALSELVANAPTNLTEETQRFVAATREVTVASAAVVDPDHMSEAAFEDFRGALSDDANDLLDALATAQATGRFSGDTAIDRVLAYTAVECLKTQKYRPAG